MLEEQSQRLALSNSDVVPYFHPENFPLFQVRVLLKYFHVFESLFFCHIDKKLLVVLQTLLQKQTAVVRSQPVDLPAVAKSSVAEVVVKKVPQRSSKILH